MEQTPLIELKGEGLALGQAHGEALRDIIKEFAARAADVHLPNLKLKTDRDALIALCRENVGHLQKYSPVLWAELEGVAQGADLNLDDVLLLNSFLELDDLRAPTVGGRRLAPALWGCTTFNVKPRATADGRPLLGQTYDMELFYAKFNVLLKITGPDGRQRLIYTLSGILGLNGLNSEGLAVVINKLAPVDGRPGVLYPFIARRLLDQPRVGDAFGAVVFTDRASGLNWQLSSAEGPAFCLETTATRYANLPFDFSLAHANHYLDPQLRALEAPNWLSHGGSFVRQQVAQAFLDERQGQLTAEQLKELTCNHVNHPRSICAHGNPGEPDHFSFNSISAVIIEPAERRLHFAGCHPCLSGYRTLTL
ncbi:MAG: C45 family peptidase [Deltaproteobacteria bacterium]|jgi:isopenicillin-N N-acyltransferase-like protein|nr:C45 family peptidase [Deltaproteobacteria bacterium]